MHIAVASQNLRQITAHAGLCRRFWIYEVVDGQVRTREMLELARDQSLHEAHGAHPLDRVQALISGGMGAGLVRRLAQKGIEGIVTTVEDPDTAVQAFVAGVLARSEPETHAHGDCGGCHCGGHTADT